MLAVVLALAALSGTPAGQEPGTVVLVPVTLRVTAAPAATKHASVLDEIIRREVGRAGLVDLVSSDHPAADELLVEVDSRRCPVDRTTLAPTWCQPVLWYAKATLRIRATVSVRGGGPDRLVSRRFDGVELEQEGGSAAAQAAALRAAAQQLADALVAAMARSPQMQPKLVTGPLAGGRLALSAAPEPWKAGDMLVVYGVGNDGTARALGRARLRRPDDGEAFAELITLEGSPPESYRVARVPGPPLSATASAVLELAPRRFPYPGSGSSVMPGLSLQAGAELDRLVGLPAQMSLAVDLLRLADVIDTDFLVMHATAGLLHTWQRGRASASVGARAGIAYYSPTTKTTHELWSPGAEAVLGGELWTGPRLAMALGVVVRWFRSPFGPVTSGDPVHAGPEISPRDELGVAVSFGLEVRP